jgi:hypothetical protein
MLGIKNHSHPNKKPCAWNFFNPILGIKNHLHPNKKPCAWNFKKSRLRIKNHLHPNKKPYAGIKNPMLRIKKPMLVVLGRGKNLLVLMECSLTKAIWQNYNPFGIPYVSALVSPSLWPSMPQACGLQVLTLQLTDW